MHPSSTIHQHPDESSRRQQQSQSDTASAEVIKHRLQELQQQTTQWSSTNSSVASDEKSQSTVSSFGVPGAFQQYHSVVTSSTEAATTTKSVLKTRSQPPQHTTTTAPKPTVRFAKKVKFAPTCRVIEGSKNVCFNVRDYWYERADLEVFKNDRKLTVKALKRNDFDLFLVERLGYVLRGFECYFSMEINKAFKYTRCLAVSLVKTEQERQKNLGLHLPDLIRESSMCASEWARDNASHLGQKDFEEAYPHGVQYELGEVYATVLRQQAGRKRKETDGISQCTSSLNRARITD